MGLVTIVVHPVNDSPEATDILIIVLEDSIATFDLLGDDVDGDELSYTLSSLPINGIISLMVKYEDKSQQLLNGGTNRKNGLRYFDISIHGMKMVTIFSEINKTA